LARIKALVLTFSELSTAVINTLAVCGLCVGLAVPLGTLLAICLLRTNVFGRKWGWLALSSQLAVPLYVFAGGWSAGFGFQGWLNLTAWLGPHMLSNINGPSGSLLAVAAIHACASIPWVCLIISMGLLWSDRAQEEIASLEGGWWRVLRYVLIPKLRPWLLASCLWSVLPILTEMVVTNLYQVPTVAEQVYLDASRGEQQPLTTIAAVGLCLLPLTCLAWLVWRSFPNWDDVIRRFQNYQPIQLQLHRFRWPLSLLVWSVVGGLVALPIFNLLAKAGWQPRTVDSGLTSYGWSLSRFGTTVVESLTLFRSEFYWTSVLAIFSSSLAIVSASALLAITPQRSRKWVSLAMLFMIAVPGPLIGIFMIWLFNRSTPELLGRLYDTTLIAPVCAQQFRLLPLAWLLLQTVLASVSRQAWELAAVDELSVVQRWRYVLLPQTWSRGLAIVLLLGVMSIGELSSTILLLPPGVTTVSMRLFELLHFGMRHQDSGLCGLLLLLGWGVSFVFWKTLNDR